MPSSPPRIAVVGGGPGGLALGVLLQRHSIPFTIFELRPKPTEEELATPSGTLDLHVESGLAAIRECGLYEDMVPLTGECSEADKIADKDGNILYADDGGLASRPEISRHALAGLLLRNIPAEKIKWGHKLLAATSSTASGHDETELDFGGNGKHTFDLVIGADGAWSKVRSLLTPVKPEYAGLQVITLTITNITEKHPHLAELVGTGSFSALGNRHGVMCQRGPLDSARKYIMLSVPDEHFAANSGLAGKTAAAAKDKLLGDDALLGSWGPTMKELVAVGCDEEAAGNPGAALDIRGLYTLPLGFTWPHRPGVTIIGDAANLMRPSGEGVNIAMWNSLLVSRAIAKAFAAAGEDAVAFQSTVDPPLREFEVEAAAFGKEKAAESVQLGEMMFGEDGANAMKNFFLSFTQPREDQ